MYGAEKPVVGDLVFDAETTSKTKENVDGDLADEASDDALDDAGTSPLDILLKKYETSHRRSITNNVFERSSESLGTPESKGSNS